LIQHSRQCIQVLLQRYHPSIASHFTADFCHAHHSLFLEHVRSTLCSTTSAPSSTLTVLNFILCCFQSTAFRNATVFRRAYNPRFPQPTMDYVRSLPDPWASTHPGTNSSPSFSSTASLQTPNSTLSATDGTPLGSHTFPPSHSLDTESASQLSAAAPIYRTHHGPLIPFLSGHSTPASICCPPDATPSESMPRPSPIPVTSPIPYQFLLRPTSNLSVQAINQYATILNKTPAFLQRGCIVLPANAHNSATAPVSPSPTLFIFLPIQDTTLAWSLLAFHLPTATIYWSGPADLSPSTSPAYSALFSSYSSRYGYGPIQTITFPVSIADSGLLIFSLIHSLFSHQTPCAPSNYLTSRRAFLGALLRPHRPAKDIWSLHRSPSLQCPRSGAHRFGTTCPTCLWSKTRPSLTSPSKLPELLPRMGIRDLTFDEFPINITTHSTCNDHCHL
jgi:hypothetical protein